MAQTALDRLLLSLKYTHGLDPLVQQAVVNWLNGKPLTDPAAIKYVNDVTGDISQVQPQGQYRPGTVGSVAAPAGAPTGAPATGAQATAQAPSIARPAQQSTGGDPGSPGMYSAYIANQQAAASHPIAAYRQAGLTEGSPSELAAPAPPDTPPVAANAVNTTATKTTTPPVKENPVLPNNPNVATPSLGDVTSLQGAALVGPNADQSTQIREALRRAGYNPDHPGLGAAFLSQIMQPALTTEASLYGLGQQNPNITGAGDFVGNIAKSFLTPGVDAFQQARQFAQNTVNSQPFLSNLADLDPNQQMQMLQNIAAVTSGGRSGLEQAAAKARTQRAFNQYQDSQFGFGGQPQSNGTFLDWLRNSPQGQALAATFGLNGQ